MAEKKGKSKAAKSEQGASTAASGRGFSKEREGVVVSDKMSKTVVVATSRLIKHSMYGKYIRRTVKFYAHDEKEECSVGDLVRIIETPPTSRLKRWKVSEIITKAV
ncbi:MAG: 30S ribosomal protein S17 [Deltaproteobacteria bacterium]|nr:30S ribosomal protein S17 [Deltaproteobacteria bacterium]